MIIKNKVQYGNQTSTTEDSYTKEEFNNIITDSVENSNTATLSHLKDSYFIYNDILYIATSDISIGNTIIPNTNCKKVSISEELQKAQDVSPGGDNELLEQLINGTITSFSGSMTQIRAGLFYNCTSLRSVSFPACSYIGQEAFCNCFDLKSISFPACASINMNAFNACSSLKNINFPMCNIINTSAFAYCVALTTINLPECSILGNYAFGSCVALTTINLPECSILGQYAFQSCRALTTVSLPKCTYIDNGGFKECSSLTTINLPECSYIGQSAFESCRALTVVSLPKCISTQYRTFASCYSLTTINLPKCSYIGTLAFFNCYNLVSLYLTNSSYVTLDASYAFSSTPIGGYSASAGRYGSIYVPASMLESYKTMTNWTYFSSRFVGI